ncbi:MAG: MOSC domain-containing protein [Spirochaetes bacterium]|nr:MOSC domain-containing protein [Spirochaetota bacterium]
MIENNELKTSGTITSLNISKEKGVIKTPVDEFILNKKGIQGDAHAGNWHRQVSILSSETIDKFSKASDRAIQPGEFAENITTSGIDLTKVTLLDRFSIGKTELEVTQIGKVCHGDNCAIYREVGNCVMPKEGIFCRVIKGGKINPNDKVEYLPTSLRIHVITLSDRAYLGEYKDKSGPEISEILQKYFVPKPWNVKYESTLIPDNSKILKKEIIRSLKKGSDIIFTTGGTGIGPRDITIDTISPMLEKELPGIMEHIRIKYGSKIPAALLSRSVAGTIKNTLIYTLPGSVKAVREYMDEINPALIHSLFMLHGINIH